MIKRNWKRWEDEILIKNYHIKTIKEISDILFVEASNHGASPKRRSNDSIDAEIKRLRKEGKIDGYKEENVVARAYAQR